MTSLPALLLIAINLSCPTPLAAADETKPAAETNDAARMVPKIKRTSQPHKQAPSKLTEELRTIDDFSKPWWRWKNATGDWDGARPWLLDHGIIAQIVYTFEVFSNVRGGVTTRNATKALGNLDVTLTVDTERMDLWKGGTLFLHFENLAGDGNGINAEVGFPLNQISNLNAADFVQLSGYYYSQELFDGALSLKMGKSNANVDFISSYISGEFINDGVSPAQNIPMPSFPDTALGFAAFWIPLDWFSVGSGVYGGDPNGESFGDAGLFAGETFSIVEFKLLDLFKDYPGLYEGGCVAAHHRFTGDHWRPGYPGIRRELWSVPPARPAGLYRASVQKRPAGATRLLPAVLGAVRSKPYRVVGGRRSALHRLDTASRSR